MKKDIGSIFPLSDGTLRQAESERGPYTGDRLYYSLCREAMFDIAKALGKTARLVLIPAYTCQTVITPFEEAGWRCEYYPIGKDLRIRLDDLLRLVEKCHPKLLVVHPFYGMDLNEAEIKTLMTIKGRGVEILLDLTQCLFSRKQYCFASFIVASYRKWMPITDGGYMKLLSDSVKISQPETENSDFSGMEKAAMYLRGQYFANGEQRTKDISIKLSKMADSLAESNIAPHKMSSVAYNLLRKEDFELIQKARLDNYAYLHQNILETKKVAKVVKNGNDVTSAPLYFTIYVQDRPALQHCLAKDAIYAPVLWPVEDDRVLINEDIKYLYDHLLAIPCDQRYDVEDLQRAVDIINQH
ncbi:MAG: hypothetical protein IKH16_11985 [Selenomonadaceae bacterium]|nr:hypothetical protein [Selenomonadaceae bacterium]